MIKILCVGKIKEKFFKEAINEYLKRISKYTKIEILEVEEKPVPKKEKISLKEIDDRLMTIDDFLN